MICGHPPQAGSVLPGKIRGQQQKIAAWCFGPMFYSIKIWDFGVTCGFSGNCHQKKDQFTEEHVDFLDYDEYQRTNYGDIDVI